MIVIHVARKPLTEANVASNVVEHGTGSINVDACRVGPEARIQVAAGGLGDGIIWFESKNEYVPGTGREYRIGRRWPANLILGHLPECRCVDEGGTESVDEWDCAPGCPVPNIDAQDLVGAASRFFKRVGGQ